MRGGGASLPLPSQSLLRGNSDLGSRPICVSTPPVALAAQLPVTASATITATSANEWLAGRHDAHLPAHQRLATLLLCTWRSRRWLASAALPPALLAPRRHAGARA